MLQYDVKAISRKFFGHEVCLPERSLSQPKPRCVCILSIHQSNLSISVRLLFLFCSRVFISRSYDNRSISSIITVERFSYDLEMKTREQNRNNKRTEIERFDWFIERIQTRVAFGWLSERSRKKTSCPRTF